MDTQSVPDSTNNGPAASSGSKHNSYASTLAHAVEDVGNAVSGLCNLPETFAEAPAGESGVSSVTSDELDWELVGNAAEYSIRIAQHVMHCDVAGESCTA
jgi:hypothetical protein